MTWEMEMESVIEAAEMAEESAMCELGALGSYEPFSLASENRPRTRDEFGAYWAMRRELQSCA